MKFRIMFFCFASVLAFCLPLTAFAAKPVPNAILEAKVAALEAQVAALQTLLAHVSRLTDPNTGKDTLRFSGMNVQVVKGEGPDLIDGTGNLIVGFNDTRASLRDDTCPGGVFCDSRGGSHNFIIGNYQNYPSQGGFVAGYFNDIKGGFASVGGGTGNTASGLGSSVSGGEGNDASAGNSSISGGAANIASGVDSSVSGGSQNSASGEQSSITGGNMNYATGFASSINGGTGNHASGVVSSISGGTVKTANGDACTTAGEIGTDCPL